MGGRAPGQELEARYLAVTQPLLAVDALSLKGMVAKMAQHRASTFLGSTRSPLPVPMREDTGPLQSAHPNVPGWMVLWCEGSREPSQTCLGFAVAQEAG